MGLSLSQFGAELFFEVLDEFVHHGLDGFVVEGLLLVLEDEVDCIALLSLGEILSFIDVEELDALQELALCLPCLNQTTRLMRSLWRSVTQGVLPHC